jgi:hypothetical protein
MRIALDESNYHTTKKSIPDRTKSAPHFGGVHRKVKLFEKLFYLGENQFFFSYFSNNICKYIEHIFFSPSLSSHKIALKKKNLSKHYNILFYFS